MDFKVTNSFSRNDLNYDNGTVKNIHYGDIHTKFQTLFDITREMVPYINKNISLDRISDDYYCKEGDIIFADASEDMNDVGKSIEVVHLNNEKLLSGLHTLLARPKQGLFFKGFNGYLFKSKNVRLQIQKEAQGTKVLSISTKRISNIKLSFPSEREQEKITSFLSRLDQRIQTQSKIIEECKLLRNYLISFYFDSEEERKSVFIGDCIRQISKRNRNGENYTVFSVSNKYGFIKQAEQFEDRVIASDNTENYKVISKNVFAYNPARINVGSIARMKEIGTGIVSPMYVCFK